jgi:hypothetical protein
MDHKSNEDIEEFRATHINKIKYILYILYRKE